MTPNPVPKKVTAGEEEEEYDDEEEESRELSHEEIWDDSALIDAWNSAAAEYEVCSSALTTATGVTDCVTLRSGVPWSGQEVEGRTGEKVSSVRRCMLCPFALLNSALFVSSWYNVPPEKIKASKGKSKESSGDANGLKVEEPSSNAEATDSAPPNFDTFVPTHDPSLASAAELGSSVPMMDGALGSGAEAAMVSQDEAFSRAMTAMYWSGYWTAVYHVCVRSVLLPG